MRIRKVVEKNKNFLLLFCSLASIHFFLYTLYLEPIKPFLSTLALIPTVLGLGVFGNQLTIKNIKSNGLKFCLFYILYLLASYAFTFVDNINNPAFNILAVLGNRFFEIRFLPILLFLILLAFANSRYPFFKKFKGSNRNDFSVLVLLSGSVIAQNSHLIVNINQAVEDNHTVMIILKLLFFSLFYLGIFSILAYHFYQAVRDIKKNSPSISLAVVSSLVLAFAIHIAIQLGVRTNSVYADSYVFNGVNIYQILFFFAFFFAIYVLCNQYINATFINILLVLFLGVGNYIKTAMRSEPILVSDWIWLKQLNLILGFLNQSVVIEGAIALVVVIAVYIVMLRLFFRGKLVKNRKRQLLYLLLPVSFFSSVFFIFSTNENGNIVEHIPILSRLNNEDKIDWLGFKTNASFKSLAFVWTKQLTVQKMDKPKNYSEKTIASLYEKYVNQAKQINETRANNIADQTVIYILSESLSDPYLIDGTQVTNNGEPVDVLANIRTILSQTTSGTMISDGYGGGTANMEFQTLTGLPYTNFSSSVSTLYTEIAPYMKYMPSISNLYSPIDRIVLHPSGATNYGRDEIYKKLGFDKMYFTEGGNLNFENTKTQGINMSDESLYQTVLSAINTNESQFFSVITMQNHTPWSEEYPQELIATNPNLSKDAQEQLTNYVRLLSYTDVSTKNFLESLQKINKKITVVFYGDHLPGIYSQEVFEDNPDLQYQTPYFIWSNFETEKLNYPFVKSSDFTAELLAVTGSKVSPYYALLTNILNNGTLSIEEQDIVYEDLNLIQYDLVSGKNYIGQYDDFFTILSNE